MATMLQIVDAIRNVLIAQTVLDLDEETCSIDLDTAVLNMIAKQGNRCCLLMFGGGARENRQPMQLSGGGGLSQRGLQWRWSWHGVYMIKYDTDPYQIEVDVLEAITAMSGMMVNNIRLGNIVPKADIIQIGQPDGADINDMTFYMIPFTIEVWTLD